VGVDVDWGGHKGEPAPITLNAVKGVQTMKARWILALALVALLATGARAIPISYISATTVPTTYIPEGGDFGMGYLALAGQLPLIVHYANDQQVVWENSDFLLTTSLWHETSEDGVVRGEFAGGAVTLKDSGGTVLLQGTGLVLGLTEVFDDIGMLAAAGSFDAEGGLFVESGEFGLPEGSVYEIVFQVQPRVLNDLSLEFQGLGNISIAPIPEPATIIAICLGLGALALRRRTRP
jgi:hypothetical protein